MDLSLLDVYNGLILKRNDDPHVKKTHSTVPVPADLPVHAALPGRSMDAAEDEPGVRAEEQISPEDADVGIAPCRMDCQDILGGNAGGEPGDGVPPAVPIKKGNGEPYLP